MGHSPAFRDAQWLAARIVNLLPIGKLTHVEHFCLQGTKAEVTLRLWPEYFGESRRSLTIAFAPEQKASGRAPASDAIPAQYQRSLTEYRERMKLIREQSLQAPLSQRTLIVHEKGAGASARLARPQTWRGAARQELKAARSESSPVSFLARYRELYVGKDVRLQEIALQLLIIFSQWGLVEITEDDRKEVINYLCSFWRKPKRFSAAAEEAVSYVLTNWVIPQDALDFRRYAKQTVWAFYAKGARASEMDTRRQSHHVPRAFASDVQGTARSSRSYREYARMDFSVTDLAQRAGVHPRRIYEAIQLKKLPAVKVRSSLVIERDNAQRFIYESNRKRQLVELRRGLEETGCTREAVRKKIYRLRKAGVPEGQLLQLLKAELRQRIRNGASSRNSDRK